MIANVIPLSRSVGVKMAAAHGAFVASVAIAAVIADRHGIDFGYLSRDPNYLAGAPFYAGAFSNLGVLLWWAGGVVALFAAMLLYAAGIRGPALGVLGAAGVLSSCFALDDLYMFHEIVIPRYVGIGQQTVFALYGLAALGWAVAFRASLLRMHPGFLLFAAALLGASAAIDVLRDAGSPLDVAVEDGLKLAGAAAWCGWLWRVAYLELARLKS